MSRVVLSSRSETCRRLQAGFTLVELMIATALIMLTLILALSLIQANHRQMQAVDANIEKAVMEAGVERIRRDLRSATRVTLIVPRWVDAPLILELDNGTQLIYTRDDRGLVRREVSTRPGAQGSELVLMRDIVGFRWRSPGSRLVDFELIWPRHEDAVAFGMAPTDRERWRVALRNRRASWW